MVLNPNEVANHKFDKAMGRGYRVDEVENYLRQIAGEIDDLIAEKREIEQKLLVLADKLEEYKHDEESLRAALLGAQKLGDSVVRDAKAKAEAIIDEANARASMMVENAKRAIEREQHSYIRMQREVATFRSKLQLIYKQHLELISSIPVDEDLMEAAMAGTAKPQPAPPAQAEPEEASPAPVESEPLPDIPQDDGEFPDIPDLPSIGYDDGQAPSLEYEDEYLPEPEDEILPEPHMPDPEPTPAKRESRFGPLKFGKDFDIKREDGKRRR